MRWSPGLTVVAAAAAVSLLTGCGASPRPELPTAAPTSVSVQVPEGGVSLRALGFVNGPADALTLPQSVVISTRVDQPDGVTVVLRSPPPGEVASYLRKALPATGFVVAADDGADALTFSGYGWSGSFAGTAGTSALALRP